MKPGPLEIIHQYEEAYRAARNQEPRIMRYAKGWFYMGEFSYRAAEIQQMTARMKAEIKQ